MYLSEQAAAVVASPRLTKSEKIRQLHQQGLRNTDIARALGIRDQFVSNVLTATRRGAKSAHTEALATRASEPLRARAQIGEGGRIVIPAAFRAALGMHVGDQVLLRVEDGELRVFTPLQGLRKAQALLRPYLPADRSLADELIAERRAEAARE